VEDMNVFSGNALADEVKINLNMLDVLMLDGVGGEGDDADIDAVNQSGLWHLLDYVGDVRPGEIEVLENLGQAAASSRVINGVSMLDETLDWVSTDVE
jgi:hypothetical protein